MILYFIRKLKVSKTFWYFWHFWPPFLFLLSFSVSYYVYLTRTTLLYLSIFYSTFTVIFLLYHSVFSISFSYFSCSTLSFILYFFYLSLSPHILSFFLIFFFFRSLSFVSFIWHYNFFSLSFMLAINFMSSFHARLLKSTRKPLITLKSILLKNRKLVYHFFLLKQFRRPDTGLST